MKSIEIKTRFITFSIHFKHNLTLELNGQLIHLDNSVHVEFDDNFNNKMLKLIYSCYYFVSSFLWTTVYFFSHKNGNESLCHMLVTCQLNATLSYLLGSKWLE